MDMKLKESIDNPKVIFALKVVFAIGMVFWPFGNLLADTLQNNRTIDNVVFVATMLGACMPLMLFAIFLSYAIFHIETLCGYFRNSIEKKGFSYALYFSLQTTMLFNPLETNRSTVTEFKRVIGSGLIAGIDVTKRIRNFSGWFLYFAVVLCLYFLLINYLRNRFISKESEKIFSLLDNVMLLANVVLGLRLISYFYRQDVTMLAFYYSDYIIILIVMLAIGYLKGGLDRKISIEKFEALIFSGWMIAYPISIIFTNVWDSATYHTNSYFDSFIFHNET